MVRRTTLSLALSATLCFSAAADAQVSPVAPSERLRETDLDKLSKLMLADFATSLNNTDETIIDRRMSVSVQDETGIWFYSQLNTGKDQEVYRQRFHQLSYSSDGETLIQRSYEPVDANRFVDGWARPDAFLDLSLADMRPVLDEGCEQVWSKDYLEVWRGTVDPNSCEIFSERRQTTIRIGADSYYRRNVFGTSERGFDQEMNLIWGSNRGDYIKLYECRSDKCEQEARMLSARTE